MKEAGNHQGLICKKATVSTIRVLKLSNFSIFLGHGQGHGHANNRGMGAQAKDLQRLILIKTHVL